MRAIVLFAAAAALALSGRAADAAPPRKYNTTSRRMPGVINLHLVPHTHDDVGWLKTIDEYYTGNRNDIQRAVVQDILNSAVKELAWNPDRKFIYVEQAFFQRWWAEQDAKMQTLVRGLVANGQLEFVNGGFSMHDEANPSFADMIDNTAIGHRFLLEEFNVTPRVAWQIDPFGHSTFQASMMSSPISGMNALFFMRADAQEVSVREAARTTEMVWAPSQTLGLGSATYAGVLYSSTYCTAPVLSMEIGSSSSPIMDDPDLEDYNVGQIVAAVVDLVTDALSKIPQGGEGGAATADGADIMLPLGCDFAYENSATFFTNTDKVIHHLNQDGRINAFYSTPSLYADAKLAAGKSYTLKTDDFMPYQFFTHGYLTGFYTSKPALKGYIRESSALLHALRQLQAFTGGSPGLVPSDPLYRFERAMGEVQHHDSITGTSKQHVTFDYARRLAWSRQDGDAVFDAALRSLTGFGKPLPSPYLAWQSCDLANATVCPALEAGQPTAVAVYNLQAQAKGAVNLLLPVGLPSGVASWAVYDSAARPVQAQLLPLSTADLYLREVYYNVSAAVPLQWLAFQPALPPAGFAVYFLVPAASEGEAAHTFRSVVTTLEEERAAAGAASSDSVLTNGVVTVTLDGTTGLVKSYANAMTGVSQALAQELVYYNSSAGPRPDCKDDQSTCAWASGAYIFRPNPQTPFPCNASASGAAAVTLVRGPVVNEARQIFASWASQVVRVWANDSAVDFAATVGPIPYADGLGREVTARYTTSLATNGTWFTDSNARDSNRRVRNFRPSFNMTVNEPVAGNYYPVPGFIYASDVRTGATVSVLPDRAQGGASITDGSLELMLHRRLQHDDELGVGEPLNETGLDASGGGLVIRTLHRLTLDPTPASAGASRRALLQDELWRPNVRFAALGSTTPAQFVASYKPTFSAVQAALPPNVHLLTVHSWGPGQLLLRLSHSFEEGEGGASLGGPATVDLASLFAPSALTLASCEERTLTGNQPLATAPTTTYNVTGGPVVTLPVVPPPPSGSGMTITLTPMSIRTFLCALA